MCFVVYILETSTEDTTNEAELNRQFRRKYSVQNKTGHLNPEYTHVMDTLLQQYGSQLLNCFSYSLKMETKTLQTGLPTLITEEVTPGIIDALLFHLHTHIHHRKNHFSKNTLRTKNFHGFARFALFLAQMEHSPTRP